MPEKSTGPIDVRTIHQLVRMMKRYDLTAIDLVEGDTKIRLRRQGADAVPSLSTVSAAGPLPPQPSAAAPLPAPPAAPSTDLVIESPMVGTYYASPSPDSPAFVDVGTAVRPDRTVCVIEAMKVFTDIPAGIAGTIDEFRFS